MIAGKRSLSIALLFLTINAFSQKPTKNQQDIQLLADVCIYNTDPDPYGSLIARYHQIHVAVMVIIHHGHRIHRGELDLGRKRMHLKFSLLVLQVNALQFSSRQRFCCLKVLSSKNVGKSGIGVCCVVRELRTHAVHLIQQFIARWEWIFFPLYIVIQDRIN